MITLNFLGNYDINVSELKVKRSNRFMTHFHAIQWHRSTFIPFHIVSNNFNFLYI